MDAPALTIAPADGAHIASIVAIEGASAATSVVALTAGGAVRAAIERGHDVIVALAGDEVVGWAWFAVEDGRDGERTGLIFRVAVALDRGGEGAGRALLAHAIDALAAGGCRSVRIHVEANDAQARAFFARHGFAETSVTMDRAL
jgi:ribosomal protein S18 acetylase RimI-like enzyme